MKTTILQLSELSCGHCVKRAKEALEAISGVESAEVTLEQAIVKGDVDSQLLVNAVIDAGYQAKVAPTEKETILQLSELSCGHCIKRVKEALEAISGVESAEVTLEQAIVKGNVDPQILVQTVIDAGYQASLANAK